MTKIYRHGDLLLQKVDSIPEGLQKKNNKVLLEGESSGHFHTLSEGDVWTITPTRDNNYLLGYFKTEEGALLTHQEHKTIEVPPGIYKFYSQREFDEIEERRVID